MCAIYNIEKMKLCTKVHEKEDNGLMKMARKYYLLDFQLFHDFRVTWNCIEMEKSFKW